MKVSIARLLVCASLCAAGVSQAQQTNEPLTTGQPAALTRNAGASAAPGTTVTVPVQLVADDGENCLAFSVAYDPTGLAHSF